MVKSLRALLFLLIRFVKNKKSHLMHNTVKMLKSVMENNRKSKQSNIPVKQKKNILNQK